MERLNWFSVLAIVLLLMILGVLWIIKEVLEDKRETDPTMIRNSRRFRQFVTQDYFFRKNHRKINLEIIQELQTTYGEYGDTHELKDELLGIKVQIKDEQSDFSFIFIAIFSLILSAIPALSELPSAIAIIPSILIMGAIASYLRELVVKINMKQGEPPNILFMLPLVLTITSVMILGILFGANYSPANLLFIDWIFRLILIEAIGLYVILLYEKVKYISYLEVVSIILNEIILEADRKNWLNDGFSKASTQKIHYKRNHMV